MAVTILPNPDLQDFGTGISKGIDYLINNKTQELLERRASTKLEKTLVDAGANPKYAKLVANVNPELQKLAFQNPGKLFEQTGGSPGMQSLAGQGTQQPSQNNRQDSGISELFTSPAERRQNEQLDLKRESLKLKQRDANWKSVEPVLKEEQQDYINKQNAGDIASEMISLIQKDPEAFENINRFKANSPDYIQDLVITNPTLRRYRALGAQLVTALAQTRRGLPTNYKLKLEAAGKANLSQPVETQIGLLKNVQEVAQHSSKRQEYIDSTKDQEDLYPRDLRRRIVQWNIQNPLLDQQEAGTESTQKAGTESIQIGSELSDLPSVDSVPEGWAAEKDGIITYKRDGKWVKKRAK